MNGIYKNFKCTLLENYEQLTQIHTKYILNISPHLHQLWPYIF